MSRGHGSESQNSDVDGSIWYKSEGSSIPMSMENIFPDEDWGVRFKNVSELVNRITNIKPMDIFTRDLNDADEVAVQIASLFGSSSEFFESQGELDKWRKEVIKALVESKASKKYIWRKAQEQYDIYFRTYSKRAGEQEKTIKKAISERIPSASEEKLERGVRLALQIRSETKLPDLDSFKKLYGITADST